MMMMVGSSSNNKSIINKKKKKKMLMRYYYSWWWQYRKKIIVIVLIGFYIWFLFQSDVVNNNLITSTDDETTTTTTTTPRTTVMVGSNSQQQQQQQKQYNYDYYDPTKICDQKLPNIVYKDWNYINEALHRKYSNFEVSGGIFLYPRQASALMSMIQHLSITISSIRQRKQRKTKPLTICETGFGSGHSMSLFTHSATAIATTPDDDDTTTSTVGTHIVSFDRFDRPYQIEFWNYLNSTYYYNNNNKHRTLFDHFKGNSCNTVPQQLGNNNNNNKIQCDILHGSSKCPKDNIDLVRNSPCGVLLTSTAMLELNEPAVYFGRQAQWRKLRNENCITKPICITENPLNVDRDFIFAKQGTLHIAKWCVAMTTGKCSTSSTTSSSAIGGGSSATTNDNSNRICDDESDIEQAVKSLRLNEICPDYQVIPPP